MEVNSAIQGSQFGSFESPSKLKKREKNSHDGFKENSLTKFHVFIISQVQESNFKSIKRVCGNNKP